MKKIYPIIVTLLFFTLLSCKKENINQYHIKADVKDFEDGSKITLYNYGNFKAIDSTTIKKGSFEFKGNVDLPFFAGIGIKGKRKLYLIQFWVENGEIIINSDKEAIAKQEMKGVGGFVKGKKINPFAINYNNYIKPFNQKQRLNYLKMKKGLVSKEYFDNYKDTLCKNVYHYLIQDNNANNYFSLCKITGFKSNFTKKQLLNYYEKLSEKLKSTPKGKSLNSYIESLSSKKIIDNLAPEIKAKDLKNKEIKLSDYKGKYVLLNFWASWCRPCINKMKEYPLALSKFKDKNLIIISYSFDVNQKLWKESSIANKINWINISNLNSLNDDTVAFKYNVKEIPTSYLINPEGVIVKIIKYDDNLINEIEEIITK